MRVGLAVILAALLPAIAAGQSKRAQEENRNALPSIGLPLPEIGLPLPSIGLSGTDDKNNRGTTPPPDRRRGGDRRGPPARRGVIVVPVPVYGWGYDPPPPTAQPSPAPSQPDPALQEPAQQAGTLVLDLPIDDKNGQVFVDDFYVGTTEELGTELMLEPGPHKVEVRVPGYKSVSVSVKVEADRVITYRGTLEPSQLAGEAPPPQAAATKPARQQTVYFIPGCYLGNVPPAEARLPASCDPSKAKTIQR